MEKGFNIQAAHLLKAKGTESNLYSKKINKLELFLFLFKKNVHLI